MYNVYMYRSATVQLLCTLYGLIVIIITFVFSVAAALTAASNLVYVQVLSAAFSFRHVFQACACMHYKSIPCYIHYYTHRLP